MGSAVRIDVEEVFALTTAGNALVTHTLGVLTQIKAARKRGPVSFERARELVLTGLGLPADLPAGPVEVFVSLAVRASADSRVDTSEAFALVGSGQALVAHVLAVIDRVQLARAGGGKVSAARVRELVLKALGLPTDLPAGVVEQFVRVAVDALKD